MDELTTHLIVSTLLGLIDGLVSSLLVEDLVTNSRELSVESLWAMLHALTGALVR